LKPSPIYDVFFALILYLLILSLANKFDSINLEFGQKKMQLHEKEIKNEIKKIKILNSKYPSMNKRFMLQGNTHEFCFLKTLFGNAVQTVLPEN